MSQKSLNVLSSGERRPFPRQEGTSGHLHPWEHEQTGGLAGKRADFQWRGRGSVMVLRESSWTFHSHESLHDRLEDGVP